MTKYFKIWLKPQAAKKIMCLYLFENRSLPLVQILFDKMPYGLGLIKYQELTESQFERARNSKHNYKNLEEVLDEGFRNRVQEQVEL